MSTGTIGKTDNVTKVGNTAVTAFPAGFSRVTDEPKQIFYDPFDSTLDTTNRWVTPVSSGGGAAAATSAGVMSLGSGSTAGGYSILTSQPSFIPPIPAWLGLSFAIALTDTGAPAGNNAIRFWGAGVVTGSTPTTTNPLGTTGNGYGFDVDTSGVLNAVVYIAGTRTVVASLASYQPSDGNPHRYIVYYRTDKIYWYIDGLGSSQLVATANFTGPTVQTLPILLLAVAGGTPPASSRTITVEGLAAWDTGKNTTQIADGTYAWRKQTVKAPGTTAVTTDSAAVVTVHPSSALPVNAAQDDTAFNSLAMLRRIVHLLEPVANVDAATRQRVSVDAFGAAASLPTVSTVSTVSTVTTVSTVSTVTNLAQIAGDPRPLVDLTRTAYNTGLRARLN